MSYQAIVSDETLKEMQDDDRIQVLSNEPMRTSDSDFSQEVFWTFSLEHR